MAERSGGLLLSKPHELHPTLSASLEQGDRVGLVCLRQTWIGPVCRRALINPAAQDKRGLAVRRKGFVGSRQKHGSIPSTIWLGARK